MMRKVQHRAPLVLPAVVAIVVALVLEAPVAVRASAQPVFSDGFESGTMAAWTTSSGVDVQQIAGATGLYAARATTASSAAYASATLGVARADLTLAAGTELLSNATAVTLLRLRTGSGSGLVSLKINTSRQLIVRNEVAATTIISASTLETGAWHTLAVHAVIAGASSTVDVTLDGVPVDDLGATTALGTSPVGRIQIGGTGTSTADVAFDDVVATAEVQDRTDPVITAAGDICLRKPGGCRGTANLVLGIAPDRALTLGDNQYPEGALQDYLASYDTTWGRFKAITQPAPGNHEWKTQNAKGYRDYFGSTFQTGGGLWYSYDVGDWHLISLDSNCGMVGGCDAGSAEYTWLEQDLTNDSHACTLAYWHHPRFSSGADHGNDPAVTPFWDLLLSHGAEVVLNGHDHDYERFALQDGAGVATDAGLREFVVGTGGGKGDGFAAPQPNSEVRISGSKGVLELTLSASGYGWRFVAVDGSVMDSGADACH